MTIDAAGMKSTFGWIQIMAWWAFGCVSHQPMRKSGNLLPKTIPSQASSMAAPEQLYIKNQSTVVVDDESLGSGSLMPMADNRGIMFADIPPKHVGDYLDVEMVAMQIDKPGTSSASSSSATASAGSSGAPTAAQAAQDVGDGALKELLASLPDLMPADANTPPIKMLKVKIVGKQNNGDLLVSYQRQSKTDFEENVVGFTASVPSRNAVSKSSLTNKDFVDVDWQEVRNGITTERKSESWQDEYTLRLSSFEEAKSATAMDLLEKRKQLDAVKQRLGDQIKMLAKEKKNFVDQRQKFNEYQEQQKKLLEDKANAVPEDATNLTQEQPKEDKIAEDAKQKKVATKKDAKDAKSNPAKPKKS